MGWIEICLRKDQNLMNSRMSALIVSASVVGMPCGKPFLKSVKHLLGQPAWIGWRLYHQRRHRANDHRFCHAAFPVVSQVVHHFATAGRVTDVYGILQIEVRGKRSEVIGVMIHVVAGTGLR